MKREIWLLAASLLAASALPSAARPDPAKAKPATAWTSEAWTGDDRPYRAIRQAINEAIRGGQSPRALLVSYRAQAAQNPHDPRAQFRWGYAAYWEMTKNPGSAGEIRKVRQAMARANTSGAYEYARLRFFLETKWTPELSASKLILVGGRLLGRDPNDTTVKYQLIPFLSRSHAKKDNERALLYAQELLRADPKAPAYHSSLGGVYFERWWKSKRTEDADKAIAAYQKYLQLAPKSDPWRAGAERHIKFIQERTGRQQRGSP